MPLGEILRVSVPLGVIFLRFGLGRTRMPELADSFDALADEDLWVQSAAVAGGYMGSSIAQGFGDGMMPVDVPNELYGVGVAAVGYAYGGGFNRELATGGAVYALDAFAQRIGVKQSINQVGGN